MRLRASRRGEGAELAGENGGATSRGSAAGLGVIVAVTVAVAAWLSVQRPGTEDAAPSVPATDVGPLDGFLAETWYLPDDPRLGFVEVPAGVVRMGSDPTDDPQAYENERWSQASFQAEVRVPRFFIGQYEVTVAQYRAFVGATGHAVEPAALAGAGDHPVANVSWPDALAYCAWLDEKLRSWAALPAPLRAALDDGYEVMLPSEVEWERAARGDDGRVYPWGAEPRHDRANFGGAATTPVGHYPCPECPFGLSDMSGNVWELTRSPFRDYPFEPGVDVVSLEADALWVMRGGSYGDPARNVRAAVRGGADPGARRPFIGFRIVLSRIPARN